MTALLLGQTCALLFIHPLPFPAGARLWMLLPLVACVATVYRATRARDVAHMPRATVITFFQIVVGMALIALTFYLVHAGVQRLLS